MVEIAEAIDMDTAKVVSRQMIFSRTRYPRAGILRFLGDSTLGGCSMRCRRKFGDCGTVGFALVARLSETVPHPVVVDMGLESAKDRTEASRTMATGRRGIDAAGYPWEISVHKH